MSHSQIIKNFDSAAPDYDGAGNLQKTIAGNLVAWAAGKRDAPISALDIGSGTGFVAAEIHRRWPRTSIAALDASPMMLQESQRKVPGLLTIEGDAATVDLDQTYELVVSSMLLHWLPEPAHILRRWRKWVERGGSLYVALPVEGSFQEWRDLCRAHDVDAGLWTLPAAEPLMKGAKRHNLRDLTMTYNSAQDFLQSMKKTGAATPRAGHAPVAVAKMRALLKAAPTPMRATYRLLFLELAAA